MGSWSPSSLPPTATPLVLCSRWETPGWSGLVVPKVASALASRLGSQISSTVIAASITPSGSRSASRPPVRSFSATCGVTSSRMGIGHRVPSARRMRSQTESWSAFFMKPVRGEKPPFRISSRSQNWRGVRSQEGQSREAAFSSAARSGPAIGSTSVPPWGSIRWLAAPSGRGSGWGTGNTETFVMSFLETWDQKRKSRDAGQENRWFKSGDNEPPPALYSAGKPMKGDKRRETPGTSGPRGRGLRRLGDDHPDAGDGGGDQNGLALPPGDDAGAAHLVGAPHAGVIDPRHHAVAEERQHLLPLLLGGGLADGQVFGDAALLLVELDPAIVRDLDDLGFGTGDRLARGVDHGAVHLDLLVAHLGLGRDGPVVPAGLGLESHPVEVLMVPPAEVEPGGLAGGQRGEVGAHDAVLLPGDAGRLFQGDRLRALRPGGDRPDRAGHQQAAGNEDVRFHLDSSRASIVTEIGASGVIAPGSSWCRSPRRASAAGWAGPVSGRRRRRGRRRARAGPRRGRRGARARRPRDRRRGGSRRRLRSSGRCDRRPRPPGAAPPSTRGGRPPPRARAERPASAPWRAAPGRAAAGLGPSSYVRRR